MLESVEAKALAEALLASDLPDRWAHVSAVAGAAVRVADALFLPAVLVSAAWLHDIGYADGVRETGFHPLDGARHLAARGVDPLVVSLVANHSSALVEARIRGLEAELANEFPIVDQDLADALCFVDMTTGPQGQPMTVRERLDEIRGRYGPGSVVTTFVVTAEDEIMAAVGRVEARLERQSR